MIHYTNKKNYNIIQSQVEWKFVAKKPSAAKHNPVGAYFTNLPPNSPGLSVLIRVPKEKLEYMFDFSEDSIQEILPLPGGRGAEGLVFYSPNDYIVCEENQIFKGKSEKHGST